MSPVTTDVAQGHRYGTRQLWKDKEKLPLVQRSQALGINSLPNEVLCEILKMAIERTPHGHTVRKRAPINVCRRWKEIIMNTPKLWCSIALAWTPKSVVEEHIKRSCQCPLDITIDGSWRVPTPEIEARLDTLIPTAYRWSTLIIEEQCFVGRVSEILNSFDSAVFPILTRLSINQSKSFNPCFPKLLSPKSLPVLKDLTLWDVRVTPDLQIPPTLERLTLFLRYGSSLNTWLPSLSRLKALSFNGNTEHLPLQPDSIHLPLLARLTCKVTHAEPFLQALLAPNLTHIDYSQSSCESLFRTFYGLRSKWKSVHELVLRVPKKVKAASDYSSDLACLCLATPEVRGIEVMDHVLNDLLGVDFDLCPIDQWDRLERVAVISDIRSLKNMQKIVPWLERRENTGKPRLKFGFSLKQDRRVKLKEDLFEEIGKLCDGVDFCMDERIAPLMPGYTVCAVSDDSPQTLSKFD